MSFTINKDLDYIDGKQFINSSLEKLIKSLSEMILNI